jgi:glycine cleavage system H protein
MRFTPSHEWMDLKGKIAKVGVSDYAQKELGQVVYIQLPKIGQVLKAGEEACILESTKAATDLYAPASGKVIAINEALLKNPSLINTAPETDGWLFQIELENLAEWDALISKNSYQALLI